MKSCAITGEGDEVRQRAIGGPWRHCVVGQELARSLANRRERGEVEQEAPLLRSGFGCTGADEQQVVDSMLQRFAVIQTTG